MFVFFRLLTFNEIILNIASQVHQDFFPSDYLPFKKVRIFLPEKPISLQGF